MKSPHCELEPAIYRSKRERATIAPLDPSKNVAIRILFEIFLKMTKYAFTQNALDAFIFFASILSLVTISQLFCFGKVGPEIFCIFFY